LSNFAIRALPVSKPPPLAVAHEDVTVVATPVGASNCGGQAE
jgi:hypothetical protein